MNTAIAKKLNLNGVKPSYQRIKIYNYLLENKTHPTVEEIYSKLIDNIPTLSKTTIYNTLDLFLEKDIVRMISIEDNEKRYDADTTDHGHFKCLNCDKVFDFKIDIKDSKVANLSGFTICEKNVYFKGTCKNCNSKLSRE